MMKEVDYKQTADDLWNEVVQSAADLALAYNFIKFKHLTDEYLDYYLKEKTDFLAFYVKYLGKEKNEVKESN